MTLNSSKVIPKWRIRYSGISLYLANSAAQSAAESGGTMPMTGFHSVIDKPERVSRVMPPTITIRKISAQQPNSQTAIGTTAELARCSGELAASNAEIDKTDPQNTDSQQMSGRLAADKCDRTAACMRPWTVKLMQAERCLDVAKSSATRRPGL